MSRASTDSGQCGDLGLADHVVDHNDYGLVATGVIPGTGMFPSLYTYTITISTAIQTIKLIKQFTNIICMLLYALVNGLSEYSMDENN